MNINTIPEIIEDIKAGKMVIIMDDEDRENEGDLIMAATLAKPDDINFMITHARGLVCLTLTSERCKKLKLPLMCKDNKAPYSTNFTVSIDAAKGVSTGISTADRAQTIKTAVSPDVTFDDVVTPGHIFPLMAKEGGVLERAGHTEAGCDLTRLAGFEPASVIVEIINQDGEMARRDDLMKFADIHNLKVGTIDALIKYIKSQEAVESKGENEVENFEETVTYEYDESDERTVELI